MIDSIKKKTRSESLRTLGDAEPWRIVGVIGPPAKVGIPAYSASLKETTPRRLVGGR